MKYIVILLGLFYSFEVFSQQPVIRPTVYSDTANYSLNGANSDTAKAIKNAGVTTFSDNNSVYLYANTDNGALYFKDSSGTTILSATSDTLKTTGAIRTGGSILMNATSPNNKIGTINDADVVFIVKGVEAARFDSLTKCMFIGATNFDNAGSNKLRIGNQSANIGGTYSTSTFQGILVAGTDNNLIYTENTSASSVTAGSTMILASNDGAALASANRLGGIHFSGSSGATTIRRGASIACVARENWTSTSTPADLLFGTTNVGSSTTQKNNLVLNATGNNGLSNGTNDAPSVPTYNLSWNGNAAFTYGGERHTTANTAGNNTTFRGIGATSGANNKSGGDLIFMSGEKTGVFSNGAIRMQTYGSSAAATADNSAYDRMVVLSTEALKDNTLDTLFSVNLGADSLFGAKLDYTVTVMDNDSAQIETGYVTLQYLRNGSTGAISNAVVTSTKGKEVAGETDVATTFSYIYAYATSTLYVCTKVNTPTGNNLNTYANIGFNGTVLGMGGRYSSLTQY